MFNLNFYFYLVNDWYTTCEPDLLSFRIFHWLVFGLSDISTSEVTIFGQILTTDNYPFFVLVKSGTRNVNDVIVKIIIIDKKYSLMVPGLE